MNKFYMILVALCTCTFAFSQANIVSYVPENAPTSTQLRAPNGLSSQTTLRAHFIIPASELTAIANGTTIEQLGFVLLDGVTANAGGNIQIYLENTADATNLKSTTWTTAISTMTSVYNGAYTIPAAASPTNADFTLSTPFTYTGGGIYVAYDYLGTTFDPADPATYASNVDVAGAVKMATTGAGVTTPPATLTQVSAYRPQMRFIYPNPYSNEVVVSDLQIEKGHPNPLTDVSQDITAEIINSSVGDLANISVTLTVTGANAITLNQTIPNLVAGASTTVTFPGLSLANTGTQNVTVSVPADEVNTNNSLTREQIISCDTLGYVTNEAPYTNIGYNTGTGILAIRQETSANVLTRIEGVSIYISEGTGNTLKGLLLDNNGTIIDSSAAVVLTAGQIGTEVYFPFTGTNNLGLSTDYYVGVRQYANTTTGYFPVGTQEPQNVPPGRVFGFDVNGGAPTEYTDLGNLMIKSVLEARFQSGSSPASGMICEGSPATLLASTGFDNYEFFVDGSSVQNGPAASYSVSPASTIHYYVSGSLGACVYTTPLDSIEVVSTIQHAFSDSFCAGEGYSFGADVLTVAGTYSDTLVSSGGCDSVVVLTLTENTVNVATTVSEATVTAGASGAGYQWIDCADNTPVNGATQQSFTPAASGNYAVIVTENGCSDTSACQQVDVSGAGIADLGTLYGLKLHPNPASDLLNVQLDGLSINAVVLTDLNGKILFERNIGAGDAVLNVADYVAGVYLLTIRTDAGNITRRFVKR